MPGRRRPGAPAASTGSGVNPGREAFSTTSWTSSTAASVTGPAYRTLLRGGSAGSGKLRLAQTGPASISSTADSAVTPHSGAASVIAQSSDDGPRSPTGPGWMITVGRARHTSSGTRSRRKGQTISSGSRASTASADRVVVHRLLPRDVVPGTTELHPHPLGQAVERGAEQEDLHVRLRRGDGRRSSGRFGQRGARRCRHHDNVRGRRAETAVPGSRERGGTRQRETLSLPVDRIAIPPNAALLLHSEQSMCVSRSAAAGNVRNAERMSHVAEKTWLTTRCCQASRLAREDLSRAARLGHEGSDERQAAGDERAVAVATIAKSRRLVAERMYIPAVHSRGSRRSCCRTEQFHAGRCVDQPDGRAGRWSSGTAPAPVLPAARQHARRPGVAPAPPVARARAAPARPAAGRPRVRARPLHRPGHAGRDRPAGLPGSRPPGQPSPLGVVLRHGRAGVLLHRTRAAHQRQHRGALPLLHHHRLHRALSGLGAVPVERRLHHDQPRRRHDLAGRRRSSTTPRRKPTRGCGRSCTASPCCSRASAW